ncbi:MAG: DUF5069 domain-containing protein [Chloroflexi bacterium]|nr:DUF5069 domain-containing protein [Chloroflexota bacterium]MCY3937109.1 DUF5069 domain-containing protein [Chloroflexota bacterium]
MDLTKDVPRSPYERLGGIVFLPRAIDKGRADLQGKLGDYLSRTGFSEVLLDFLGLSVDGFLDALRERETDEQVLEWVSSNMTARSADEIEEFNRAFIDRTPQNEEEWERYRSFLAEIGQSHRTDITRQFDRLDLDEGREVPQGGRRTY